MNPRPRGPGRTGSNLLNVLLYQTGWFACVLGAAHGHARVGTAVAGCLLGVHLLLARHRRGEALLVLSAVVLGAALDSLQSRAGLVAFAGPPLLGWLCPAWILVMWAQFATLFHHALAWLLHRPLLGAALGGVGGPLAYYAGVRLDAASFPSGLLPALASLAVEWALAIPLLLWAAARTGSEDVYRGLGTHPR